VELDAVPELQLPIGLVSNLLASVPAIDFASMSTAPDPEQTALTAPFDSTGDGRTRLLRVAMRQFAALGFDGVTVRSIASEAGVSAGLIKHHFGSKEGLRDAVDAMFLKRSGAAIERALEASQRLDAKGLAEYEKAWLTRYASEWPDFVAYLRRAILEASPWGQSLFKRYFESIRNMTDRWDMAGRIAPDVDRLWLPMLYAFMLLGPLVLDPHIQSMLGKSTYEPEMWARFQRAVHALVWKGIGTAPPDPPAP
jgi:AcrR family transcriptional regulator